MSEVNVMGRIKVNEPVANIDVKYGPYISKEVAYNTLGVNNMDVIAVGLTVGIIENDSIVEYWFQGGTDFENLIKKTSTTVVDISELSVGNIIEAAANTCVFVYKNNPVYSFPCIHDGSNSTLSYAHLIIDGIQIDKVCIISGRTVTNVYEGNNIPDWIYNTLPDVIAKKIVIFDNITTWK